MKSSQEGRHQPGQFDDIRKLVEAKHVDLKSELAKGQILKGKVQDMTVQMDELNTSITSEIRPALSDSTEQLQRATAELAETSQLLQLVEQLLRLGRQLADSRRFQEAGRLTEAADSVAELRQQAHQLAEQTGDQVSLLSDLREQALVQGEAVLHALVSNWRAALSWDEAGAVLTIRPCHLPDTAAGLRRLDRLQRHLQRLAEDVLSRLVAPLLAGGRLERSRDGDTVTLSVLPAARDSDRSRTDQDGTETDQDRTETDQDGTGTDQDRSETNQDGTEADQDGTETDQDRTETDQDRSGTDQDRSGTDQDRSGTDQGRTETDQDRSETNQDRSGTDQDRSGVDQDGAGAAPAVDAVYAALTELLTTLRDAALPGPLMAEFGTLAGPPLAERLVEGPLSAAIPSGLEERAAFDSVIQSTEMFSAALAEIGFWDRAGALLSYVSDVDRLMVDRLCAARLAAARSLVTEPLHVTVPIGESPQSEGPEPGEGELPQSLFRLPRCRVSESAVRFADLVESTVAEAAAGPELLSARLHYTARHMLELYCALLPAQHEHQLETLPQQAAIAHNNLQYLAHCVTALSVQHRIAEGSFLDLVPELRQTGSELFLAALNRQKEQLLDIISEAGLEHLDTETDVLGPAGAALRQCRHQLRHVCRVWRPVLPGLVQARAAGLLLGVVSGRLTERILAQQDISASAATQLATAAAELVTEAPSLFRPEEDEATDPGQEDGPTDPQSRPHAVSEAEARALLVRHTVGWERFTELLGVLEENMRGILDRWSDGKGPLAQHFSPEEARHLVRALFQNNERRAATLARIK